MEEFIYNQLRSFKNLTMSLIDAVNFGDTDLVLDLLDQRQIILNELEGCDRDLFMKCSKELEILKMDLLLETLMKNKISDIYNEIKNLNLERKTVQAYNNKNYEQYSVFSYEV